MRMPIKQVLEPLIHSAAMTLSLLAVYSIQGKSLPWFAWVIAFALFAIAAQYGVPYSSPPEIALQHRRQNQPSHSPQSQQLSCLHYSRC